METPVSWLSQYIGFLVKILILWESHEIVPFVSLRTHDQMIKWLFKISKNNKTCCSLLSARYIDEVGSKLRSTR